MGEFVIAGILPKIASTFQIGVPAAGYMVTLYALGVFVSAPLMAMLGTRFRHKHVLIVCMTIFIIGNIITALASTFAIALIGCVIASLNQGAFFGIGFLVAMSLVSESKQASAIAYVFSGLTAANLVGIPVATWLSPIIGWQRLFYVMAVIGLLCVIGLIVYLPSKEVERSSIHGELKAFKDPQVMLAMVVTVLGPSAFIDAVTYISPVSVNVAHFSQSMVPLIMVIFGLGLMIGNLLGGRLADKSLFGTLFSTLILQIMALLALWLGASSQIIVPIAIFFVALFGFVGTPPIQKLVMDRANTAGASVLAASVNIGMFNLGNALGAWAGGISISAGFGYASSGWSGAILAFAALLVTFVAFKTQGNPSRS